MTIENLCYQSVHIKTFEIVYNFIEIIKFWRVDPAF